MILPKSYCLADVTLSDRNAYASGGSTNIRKGQLDGRQVCIEAFRTQKATNLASVKQVCYGIPEGEYSLVTITGSIARS